MIKNNRVWLGILLLLTTCAQAQEGKTAGKEMDKMWGDTTVNVNALKTGKGKLFDEGNFGMFIHWGLFSQLGGKWQGKTYYGIGEWIMNPRMANISVEDYKAVAKNFNPTAFDAHTIAQLAKDAGMKYIIITSKHHEGFAMFKSKASSFNIVDATPFGRDPIKELSAACHELGLGFGFYYSHNQDWTAPGGSGGPALNADGTKATFDDYFYKKCLPQVKEICTNYGPIDFIWFDTPGNMKKELVVELAAVVHKLQPKAMLGSRIGYGMGDYASIGDMEVPVRNIKGLWETCDTNNDSWAYAWYDNNFKSPLGILERLISTIARGGTYLFNVGPDSTGTIPAIGAQFLRKSGKWIRKYPQVIYGAQPSPWGHGLPFGDVTIKGNSLFLSVFSWPQDGKLYLPGLQSAPLSASLLSGSTSKNIHFRQENGWTIIDIPLAAPDAPVSVIELKLSGNAAEAKVNPYFGIDPVIETNLLVEFADVSGVKKGKISWMEKFGEWKFANQASQWEKDGKVTWTVDIQRPNYYYLDAACRQAESHPSVVN
ncbi:alpha-L-fucosidase [bacterium A37T11]|nr:alpha-L-fucosidase [bacterium A37T11]